MTDRSKKEMRRICVFYDGSFFHHISNYYRYHHERRQRISIAGLHNFITGYISEAEDISPELCVITEAHYFRGRHMLSPHEQAIVNERTFDNVLIREGIVTHYLPLSPKGEKGIDVWLALEAHDLVMRKGYDVCALIAGDGDFLPLVQKIQAMGARMMLLGWDFHYEDEMGREHQTCTSKMLQEKVVYSLQMDEIIGEESDHSDEHINGVFVGDSDEEEYQEGNRSEAVAATGTKSFGTLLSLREGYGFISPDEPGENIFFYHQDLLDTTFNDLQEGDRVEYRNSMNDRGRCAIQVRVLNEE